MQPGPMFRHPAFGPDTIRLTSGARDGMCGALVLRLEGKRRQTADGMTRVSGSTHSPTMICADDDERRELDKKLSCLDCDAACDVAPNRWGSWGQWGS